MKGEPDDKVAHEDEAIEHLLGAVGPRPDVPADAMEQVRQNVHAEWRAMIGVRHRRRRLFAYGLAASGVFAVLATFALFMLSGNAGPVATVTRVVGTLEASDAEGGVWRKLAVGAPIEAGQVLRASVDGRAALTQRSGIQLRLDAGSMVGFDRADQLSLSTGAVYVDADPAVAADAKLEVVTAFGAVSHVGTQFEVRNRGRMVEINVREGSVRLRSPSGENFARAGEQLRVTASSIERRPLSLHDPLWQWALQVAPEFTIEGVPLTEFLRWVSRETGRELVYLSPQAEQAARTVVLHGSIGALPADVALPAVLSTTRLVRAPGHPDTLRITLRSAPNVIATQPAH